MLDFWVCERTRSKFAYACACTLSIPLNAPTYRPPSTFVNFRRLKACARAHPREHQADGCAADVHAQEQGRTGRRRAAPAGGGAPGGGGGAAIAKMFTLKVT